MEERAWFEQVYRQNVDLLFRVGALLGLFSAFMPPIVSYFVPWGYFELLSAYEVAVWDQATHTVIYGTRPYNWALLLATIALGLLLFALAWRRVRKEFDVFLSGDGGRLCGVSLVAGTFGT